MGLSYNHLRILLFTSFALLLNACSGFSDKDEKKPVDYVALEEQMMIINTQLVTLEDDNIKKFLENKDWEMTETGTGLRWMLLENGDGEKTKTGQIASLEYRLSLLSGELMYSSESMGIKSFKIGQGGVERGLEEGILFLKIGDKSRFVLPSHLAYGLQGDGQSIPQKASLVYEVKLIDLK